MRSGADTREYARSVNGPLLIARRMQMQILPIVAVGPAKLTISSVESAVPDLQGPTYSTACVIITQGRCTGCGVKNNPLRKVKFFKNYFANLAVFSVFTLEEIAYNIRKSHSNILSSNRNMAVRSAKVNFIQ